MIERIASPEILRQRLRRAEHERDAYRELLIQIFMALFRAEDFGKIEILRGVSINFDILPSMLKQKKAKAEK